MMCGCCWFCLSKIGEILIYPECTSPKKKKENKKAHFDILIYRADEATCILVVTCSQVLSRWEPTPRQSLLQWAASNSPRLGGDLMTVWERQRDKNLQMGIKACLWSLQKGTWVKVPPPPPHHPRMHTELSLTVFQRLEPSRMPLSIYSSTPPPHLPQPPLFTSLEDSWVLNNLPLHFRHVTRDGNKMQMAFFPSVWALVGSLVTVLGCVWVLTGPLSPLQSWRLVKVAVVG